MRIIFRHREQAHDTGAQLLFGSPHGGDIAAGARLRHCGAGAHDFFQRFLFVLHVLPAAVDELGQFIVALLEQHVDIGPGLLQTLAYRDQAVVDADQINGQHRDERQNDN